MANKLEITYSRSAIGRSPRQRRTLEALGLRRLRQSVVHEDNATIRGMIEKVHHLVEWHEIEEGKNT